MRRDEIKKPELKPEKLIEQIGNINTNIEKKIQDPINAKIDMLENLLACWNVGYDEVIEICNALKALYEIKKIRNI